MGMTKDQLVDEARGNRRRYEHRLTSLKARVKSVEERIEVMKRFEKWLKEGGG